MRGTVNRALATRRIIHLQKGSSPRLPGLCSIYTRQEKKESLYGKTEAGRGGPPTGGRVASVVRERGRSVSELCHV